MTASPCRHDTSPCRAPLAEADPIPPQFPGPVFPASSFDSWPSRFVTLSTRQSPGPHRHAGQFLPPDRSHPMSCHQTRQISPLMIVLPRERQFLSAATRLRHRGDRTGPEASEMRITNRNPTPFHTVGDRFGILAKSPHSWSTSDHHINHANHSVGGPCARPAHRRV